MVDLKSNVTAAEARMKYSGGKLVGISEAKRDVTQELKDENHLLRRVFQQSLYQLKEAQKKLRMLNNVVEEVGQEIESVTRTMSEAQDRDKETKENERIQFPKQTLKYHQETELIAVAKLNQSSIKDDIPEQTFSSALKADQMKDSTIGKLSEKNQILERQILALEIVVSKCEERLLLQEDMLLDVRCQLLTTQDLCTRLQARLHEVHKFNKLEANHAKETQRPELDLLEEKHNSLLNNGAEVEPAGRQGVNHNKHLSEDTSLKKYVRKTKFGNQIGSEGKGVSATQGDAAPSSDSSQGDTQSARSKCGSRIDPKCNFAKIANVVNAPTQADQDDAGLSPFVGSDSNKRAERSICCNMDKGTLVVPNGDAGLPSLAVINSNKAEIRSEAPSSKSNVHTRLNSIEEFPERSVSNESSKLAAKEFNVSEKCCLTATKCLPSVGISPRYARSPNLEFDVEVLLKQDLFEDFVLTGREKVEWTYTDSEAGVTFSEHRLDSQLTQDFVPKSCPDSQEELEAKKRRLTTSEVRAP